MPGDRDEIDVLISDFRAAIITALLAIVVLGGTIWWYEDRVSAAQEETVRAKYVANELYSISMRCVGNLHTAVELREFYDKITP